jgi:hypothetical protein
MPRSRGEYVVVRSRNQGCVCGFYQGHSGTEVTLTEARQIYSWSGNRLTLFDVCEEVGEVRLSAPVAEITMTEACGIITPAPEVAKHLQTLGLKKRKYKPKEVS